jgi:hypothetical protein
VSGAFVGGALFALLPWVQSTHPSLAGLVFAGIAAVAIFLGRQPNGLAGILASWVAVLRRPAASGAPEPPSARLEGEPADATV